MGRWRSAVRVSFERGDDVVQPLGVGSRERSMS